ncbi:MAG: hypothetical protein ACLT4Y_09650 [Bifidobacterium breve]
MRIRLWLRDPAGTGTGGAIALLSRDEAAVWRMRSTLAQLGRREGRRRLAAHRCERHRGLDHDPVHGMQGRGHIALTVTEAGRLASWLHDMADAVGATTTDMCRR